MATLFSNPPWYFADVDLRFEDPRLVSVFRYLESLKGDAAMPAAERFDPLDLAPHLGDLFVVRVEQDAERPAGGEPVLRYSLIGTRLVDALGRDATGLIVAETFPAGHPVNDVYRYLLAHRVPVRTFGRLDWASREYRRFESVLMPLAGGDGSVVKIVGAAVYAPVDRPVVRPGPSS